jgi:hypothetical protein
MAAHELQRQLTGFDDQQLQRLENLAVEMRELMDRFVREVLKADVDVTGLLAACMTIPALQGSAAVGAVAQTRTPLARSPRRNRR